MNRPRVTLADDELEHAREIGTAIETYARENNLPDPWGLEGSHLAETRLGSVCELAVAKYLEEPWEPVVGGNFREITHDVGGCEVRGTRYRTGQLITHPPDHDWQPHILVLAHEAPTFIIHGWAWGYDAKVNYGPMPGKRDRECFKLAQWFLKPMQELPDRAHRVAAAIR